MIKNLLCAAMLTTVAAAWGGAIEPTTIVDGQFATGTVWYTMQIHSAGYYLSNEINANGAMPIGRTESEFSNGDMWCFVGNDTDGYTIYNRAEGTSKALAAPTEMRGTTGAESYPVVKDPGEAGYCYQWVLTAGAFEGSNYMAEKGYPSNRVNVRDGQLAFWTGGADAGSSVVINKVPFASLIEDELVVCEEPRTTLTGSITPALDNNGNIVLGDCAYTFNTPEGKVVHEYTLRYADGTSKKVRGRGESNAQVALHGPATLENIIAKVYDKVQPGANGYVLFRYDGTPGFNIVYRIPAIVTIPAGPHAGRIYAVNDYRYCGGDIGGGRIDLHQSYSDDNGLTWTTPDVMRNKDGKPVAMGTGAATPAGTKQSETNLDCGFGDPAVVADRESGDIFMVACAGRMGFFASRRADPQPSARWWSTDGGETWTEPDFTQWEQIYSLFDNTCKYGYIDGQFIGSGRMVQSSKIKVGTHYRIYAVMSGRNAEANNISNWVLYSDDFGHNWNVLGDPMNPAITYNADEPKCEELPDGSILLAARGNGGGRNFNIFRYTNIEKAEGNWDEQINTNLGTGHGINACNGEILIVPVKNAAGEKAHMAIQSFPNSTSRQKVSLAYKVLRTAADYDKPADFNTWDNFYELTPMSSAYSTMTLQSDHSIGVLFEERTFNMDYCEIYRNITIPELTGNAWEYDAEPADATAIMQDAVQNKMNEMDGYTETNIVGIPTAESIAAVKEAGATFLANPTEANYLAFNAVYNSIELTMPVSGGIYSFKNAHGGKYNISGDRWLAAGATALTIASTEGENTRFIVFFPSEEATNFSLYNESEKRYVMATPAAVETAVSTTAKASEAGEYNFAVSPGKVAINCQNPGHQTYSSIHMNGSQRPVIWTESEAASKWVMTFLGNAESLPNPDDEEDSITEISSADKATAARFHDLQGREVATPRRGQIIITDTRRKLIAQ